MTMTRGFKLFHTVFLVFAWQCCAKVTATFNDVTGVVDLGLNHQFSFRAFGSHGSGIPKVGSSVAPSVDMQSPAEAPGIAPVGLETPMSKDNKALSFSLEIKKGLTTSLGLEIPKSKGDVVLSHGHEIRKKSGVNIDISNGGKVSLKSSGSVVVSNAGKPGLKSRENVVSHGLGATKSSNVVISHHDLKTLTSSAKKTFSFGLETKKSIALSHGLRTHKSKGGIVVSHGHGINLKNGGSISFSHGHGAKISVKSKGSVGFSHGLGIRKN